MILTGPLGRTVYLELIELSSIINVSLLAVTNCKYGYILSKCFPLGVGWNMGNNNCSMPENVAGISLSRPGTYFSVANT